MSTPASEVAAGAAAQPTATVTPTVAPTAPAETSTSWYCELPSWIKFLWDPSSLFTGGSGKSTVLSDGVLIGVGIILALGAVLIGINAAQKPDTVSNIQGGISRVARAATITTA
jgi:hypothetical protein